MNESQSPTPRRRAGRTSPRSTSSVVLTALSVSWIAGGLAFTGCSSPGESSGRTTLAATAPGGGNFQGSSTPDWGPNVHVFSPGDTSVQGTLDSIWAQQETNQFGSQRQAYLFRPGVYDLDVQLGFYTEAMGLGSRPGEVQINGAVRSSAKWFQGNASQNFWRGVENLAINPTLTQTNQPAHTGNLDVWPVSQAAWMRRVWIQNGGGISLFDPWGGPNDWASGGFMADSVVSGTVISGSQQQWLTRNSSVGTWVGGIWNQVFVNTLGAPRDTSTVPAGVIPAGAWPDAPFTVINAGALRMREKPYLVNDGGGYAVVAPTLAASPQGTTWQNLSPPSVTVPISRFYVAHEGDTADAINGALSAGANLVLTPGLYHLSSALNITRPGTIVLGIGFPTLTPDNGTPAISIADVDAVTVAGVLLEAGAQNSRTLLLAGEFASSASHSDSPTAIYDVSCRVGGAGAGKASSCAIVNSNDVILDNVWLWRADHGEGVGWDVNTAQTGLVVVGDNVAAYGLFVEHFQQNQVVWAGNGGRVYMYQSEFPYDVPSQAQWMDGTTNGWTNFTFTGNVTSFDGQGFGIYCYFFNPVVVEDAIVTPRASDTFFKHVVTQWFKNAPGSAIEHIINGSGAAVDSFHQAAFTSF